MKRFTSYIVLFILILLLVGCNSPKERSLINVDRLVGEEPPDMAIHVHLLDVDLELGSYCWTVTDWVENKTKCIDKIVPGEDAPYITVLPREMMQIKTDYARFPEEATFTILNEEGIEMELKNRTFFAPLEPGIYEVVLNVRWVDENDKNVSLGDASYGFKLSVGDPRD